MKIGDPSDNLDAAADGNFGGKHTTNRRAGYSKTVTINGEEITELEWLIRRAKKDATLASGEGRKIVEHYEAELDALWRTLSDQIVIANQMDDRIMAQYEEMTRLAQIIGRLREPSEAVMIAAENAMDAASATDCVPGDWNTAWVLEAIKAAVAAAEKEVDDA